MQCACSTRHKKLALIGGTDAAAPFVQSQWRFLHIITKNNNLRHKSDLLPYSWHNSGSSRHWIPETHQFVTLITINILIWYTGTFQARQAGSEILTKYENCLNLLLQVCLIVKLGILSILRWGHTENSPILISSGQSSWWKGVCCFGGMVSYVVTQCGKQRDINRLTTEMIPKIIVEFN